jgi:membrane dipeptidase
MINLGCEFISQRSADTSPWIRPELGKDARCEQATLDEVVAHFEHIRRIVGVDFIGLGSDFDGVSCTPKGLEDVSQWPNLTRRLLERGFSPEEIRKIYGGNFLRFLRAVEKTAEEMAPASGATKR